MPLPYTKGAWVNIKPVTIALCKGGNSLMFTCRTSNRGLTPNLAPQ